MVWRICTDNLHYEKFADGTVKCIEDEIPFDVPEGWEWARIGSVCIINPRNNISDSLDVSFIPMPLISEGYANTHSYEIRTWNKVKNGFTHFAENDIGIAKITPCFENRKSVIFKDLVNGYGAGTTELHILRTLDNTIANEYLLWIAKMDSFIQGGIHSFSGAVGQQRVGKDYLSQYLIPIPPRNEQIRIIQKINLIFKFVIAIENEKRDLEEIIQQAKSKILDLAIRGKLVSQDPTDEPAFVLLERIRTEKEELIKKGKIKRDKKESIIFKAEDNSYYETVAGNTVCLDNELPFQLPEGWVWSRLQNISSVLTDGTHKTPIYSNDGYVFLSSKNVTTGKIDWDNVMYISEELHEELYKRLAPMPGDILLAKNGTTGVAALVDKNIVFDIYVSLALIRITKKIIEPQYILYIIGSSYIQEYFNKSLKGIGVPNLHLEHIRKTLIPIPPYAEQIRIIECTSKISDMIEKISEALL